MRKVGVAAVLVLLAAGCGSHRAAKPPPPPPPPPTTTAAAPAPVKPPHVRKPVRLEITVINGDTWRRVPGALVTLWHRRDRTDRHGTAKIRVPWRRPLDVHVVARGFTPRTVPQTFRRRRKVAIRVYRPELQWPIFGANDHRTQDQAAIKLRPPFRSVWWVPLSGLLEYSAVVSDGVAYIGNANARIYAISMLDGSIIWRHDTPRAGLASSPAVWGDKLVYHDMRGTVWMLDRASGRVRWHYNIGSPIESSPIVRNGIDYFGTWDGRIFALDLKHGRIRWVHDVGSKITGSVVLDGNVLYLGDYSGRLWSLYARTGSTRWTGSVNGRIYGTTAVANGRVFVPSSDGRSFSAFSTSGRKLWTRYFGAYVYSSPAVWGGRVFFGSYNGVFYCLSAANGSTLWAISTGGSISGAAVVVDGVAYAGSFAHRIYGVDARTGRILVRFPHGHYIPVSGNGMRLLFHGYGALYAVEPVRRAVATAHKHKKHRKHHR
jgi:outer membrane protein assembly factor BamB